jgi:hypothetical protein
MELLARTICTSYRIGNHRIVGLTCIQHALSRSEDLKASHVFDGARWTHADLANQRCLDYAAVHHVSAPMGHAAFYLPTSLFLASSVVSVVVAGVQRVTHLQSPSCRFAVLS